MFAFDVSTGKQTMFQDAAATLPVQKDGDPVYVWKASAGSAKDSMRMTCSGTPAAVY
jgi:hypothetical protein